MQHDGLLECFYTISDSKHLTSDRYGYHVPRTQARDNYYKKLEEERAAKSPEQV